MEEEAGDFQPLMNYLNFILNILKTKVPQVLCCVTSIPVTVPLNAAVTLSVAVPTLISATRTRCGVVHLMVALTLTVTTCFRGHGTRIIDFLFCVLVKGISYPFFLGTKKLTKKHATKT